MTTNFQDLAPQDGTRVGAATVTVEQEESMDHAEPKVGWDWFAMEPQVEARLASQCMLHLHLR